MLDFSALCAVFTQLENFSLPKHVLEYFVNPFNSLPSSPKQKVLDEETHLILVLTSSNYCYLHLYSALQV
jgi:hypothetical protein